MRYDRIVLIIFISTLLVCMALMLSSCATIDALSKSNASRGNASSLKNKRETSDILKVENWSYYEKVPYSRKGTLRPYSGDANVPTDDLRVCLDIKGLKELVRFINR